MTICVLCDLVEPYWCVCDPSPGVPNLTWFVSYFHLTDSDVDISRWRLTAFLYSAAIFFEIKLQIFFLNKRFHTNFSVSVHRVAKKIARHSCLGTERTYQVTFLQYFKTIICVRYLFLNAVRVFCT
jgi:hypothetical protein